MIGIQARKPLGRPGSHGPLNDYDYLVQALFAEQANTALESHRRLRAGPAGTAELTKFEKLSEIWDRLLPHRRLNIGGDDITVSIPDNVATYPASDMSDGERAVFYLVGQTLAAHVHPCRTVALPVSDLAC